MTFVVPCLQIAFWYLFTKVTFKSPSPINDAIACYQFENNSTNVELSYRESSSDIQLNPTD